jgi:hypothetical protein
VDHFCLRAVASCSNDVNSFNNDVQSNIAYAPYVRTGFSMVFLAGNPTKKEIPLELTIHSSLPKGWTTRIEEKTKDIRLKPGEERPLTITIGMTTGADRKLEPPLDGEFKGHVFGCISGAFEGVLNNTQWNGQRLLGRFSASIADVGTIIGALDGRINPLTGEVKGHVAGAFQCLGKEGLTQVCVGVQGCLRPLRRLNIRQDLGSKPIGGITIQVQVPPPPGPCSQPLPPIETHVPFK